MSPAGNYYVTNSRFEGSAVFDASVPNHACSFRRVVSVGSRQFLTGNGGLLKVHGCYVHSWGAAGAAVPAIEQGYNGRGPWQILDTVFAAPLHPSSSAIALFNAGANATLLLSNVSMVNNGSAPLLDPVKAARMGAAGGGRLYTLPPGAAAVTRHLAPLGRDTHFLRSGARMPGRVFDAVRDFAADARGARQSGAAIQACINAAAAQGNGSVCYLWAGIYKVNRTLTACGTGFSLEGGGSGQATQLFWDPAAPGPAVLFATGPGAGCAVTNFSIRQMNFVSNAAAVAGGVADFVVSRAATLPRSYVGRYPAVALPGAAPAAGGAANQSAGPTSPGDAAARGCAPIRLQLDSLYFMGTAGAVIYGLQEGDVVTGDMWDGHVEVVDSDRALVMPNIINGVVASGVLIARVEPAAQYWQRPCVAGREAAVAASSLVPGLPGLTGTHSMTVFSQPFDVVALNSSSFVVADIYSETAAGVLYAEGDGASPPGSLVMSHSKLNIVAGVRPAVVRGYEGVIMVTGALLRYFPYNLSVSGSVSSSGGGGAPNSGSGGAPVSIAVVASASWGGQIPLEDVDHSRANVTLMGNRVDNNADVTVGADRLFADSAAVVSAGFDRLRLLGAWDMYLNFPWIMPAPQPQPLPSPTPAPAAAASPAASGSAAAVATATPALPTAAASTAGGVPALPPAVAPPSVSPASLSPSAAPVAASESPNTSATPTHAAAASSPVPTTARAAATGTVAGASGIVPPGGAAAGSDDSASPAVAATTVLASLSGAALGAAAVLGFLTVRLRRRRGGTALTSESPAVVWTTGSDCQSVRAPSAAAADTSGGVGGGFGRPLSIQMPPMQNPLHGNHGTAAAPPLHSRAGHPHIPGGALASSPLHSPAGHGGSSGRRVLLVASDALSLQRECEPPPLIGDAAGFAPTRERIAFAEQPLARADL
jgi:hypothetical protein